MLASLANYLSSNQPDDAGGQGPVTVTPGEPTNGAREPDDVVTQLVDRLQSGELSDEQLRVLREHLAPRQPRGVEVKLDHLRSTVFDLEAYTEALRAFIDDEGTAGEVLSDIRGDLRSTAQELDDVADSVEHLEEDTQVHDERLDQLHEAVLSLSAYIQELEERHDRDIEDVGASLDRLETSVSAELDELETKLDGLERLSDQQRSLNSVIDEMARMQEDLEDLETFRSNFIEAVSPSGVAQTSD